MLCNNCNVATVNIQSDCSIASCAVHSCFPGDQQRLRQSTAVRGLSIHHGRGSGNGSTSLFPPMPPFKSNPRRQNKITNLRESLPTPHVTSHPPQPAHIDSTPMPNLYTHTSTYMPMHSPTRIDSHIYCLRVCMCLCVLVCTLTPVRFELQQWMRICHAHLTFANPLTSQPSPCRHHCVRMCMAWIRANVHLNVVSEIESRHPEACSGIEADGDISVLASQHSVVATHMLPTASKMLLVNKRLKCWFEVQALLGSCCSSEPRSAILAPSSRVVAVRAGPNSAASAAAIWAMPSSPPRPQ